MDCHLANIFLAAVVDARELGAWRAVERDMADWANQKGIQRRSSDFCRRRYSVLEPEKFARYMRVRRKECSAVPVVCLKGF